ncbi:zona pellucida sperm-binding protein 3-like [Cyclopterus lumpus]|uniref:zona pellucida sperm-binding protein 3-like n=1 Tax=Cyclopterus lumpus TaxID=8103 RepID=UPI001486718D|nr:zona pellucida sperm-binding protein 3-like [Cyclopterus lumpus]XP_034384963.1 zona pellucida sperm-binding protein 3-like [Cyclopterus lumpus]XP_034384971.1 zona pellucida sperm-binding protein 3-like [Cyclopterus lumpus]
MGSSQLFVLGFVLACVSFSAARFLRMRPPNYLGVEVEPAKAAPERGPSRKSTQQAAMFRAKQIQPVVDSLSWRFPKDPVDLVKVTPVNFELRQPDTDNRVAVRCGESKIQVEVSQDLLGLGKLIDPEDITLGGCSPTEIDDWAHVLVFEYELHNCGSKRVMTEDDFIYAFSLIYDPKVSGRSHITRTQSAVIGVECHYMR